MSAQQKRNLDETRYGYSWLKIRSVNDEKRIIEGIATTPTQARDGDILETRGIKYKLPIPFLYRHKEPFGNVVAAAVSDSGITVTIQAAPAGTSRATDEQWNLVKTGTVRGLSIGWKTIKEKFDAAINGFRILESDWLELSAVPVPADANATITSVRSASEAILAASGNRNRSEYTATSPGVTGQRQGNTMKTLKEQIASFEAKRTAHRARMTEIKEGHEADGRDMPNAEEAAEFDPLAAEVRQFDAQIERLRAMDDAAVTAKPVRQDPDGSGRVAPTGRVEVQKVELPKGTGMARAVIALIRAGGNHFSAAQMAQQYYKDTPEVSMFLRAVVDAGDTTTSGWASQLVPAAQQMMNEFIELLRPATILGKITKLKRVPFNISVPIGTGGGSYAWVGEGKPKPVSAHSFGNATLRWAKAAGIVVITEELAKFSSPSAEAIIRQQMIDGCAEFLDGQFIDPAVAEVSNVSPASITNGIAATTGPSGTTAAAFRYDMVQLIAAFTAAHQKLGSATILMSETSAVNLAAMVNALGNPEFPGITVEGGSTMGLPVVVSETVADRLILVNAADILFADDGGMSVAVSREASIEMSSTPIGGEESPITGAVFHSMFQRNEVALRVERFISWKRARTSAVAWIDNVAYAADAPA